MAESHLKHVMNLGNSIIGVSVLAMPFCFKQCGILLGILILTASAFLTRFNCHLLLKAALLCRRKTFEHLAFHSFGFHGKVAVEMSITAFLLGILISFYVVIGDIAPAIVSETFDFENKPPLRTLILTAIALGVALPLGLLKNISSLSNVSAMSFCFYALLIFKIFIDALPVLVSGTWWDRVSLWKPEGMLQCLPIFALALSCQTQIFEIYDCLPDPSLGKMNRIIKLAVHLCVVVYVCVGFLGYVAFCEKDFKGNVLVNMPSSFVTEIMKLGFVVSVAVSFPLVIFPCRTSLCSLLSKKAHLALEIGGNFMTEQRFRAITLGVVLVTLVLGILCPNIELVLGLVGSTIGSIICIIFPAIMFIRVTNRNTFERYGAQVVLCAGVFLLVACTHVTVNKSESVESKHLVQTVLMNDVTGSPEIRGTPAAIKSDGASKVEARVPAVVDVPEPPKIEKPVTIKFEIDKQKELTDSQNEQRRLEPPVPQEPDSNAEQKNKEKIGDAKVDVQQKPDVVPDKPEKKSIATTAESKDVAKQQEVLLKKLEQQQQEQMKLIEEQKQLLEQLREHESHHKEEKHEEDRKRDQERKDAKDAKDGKEGDVVKERAGNVIPKRPKTQRPKEASEPSAQRIDNPPKVLEVGKKEVGIDLKNRVNDDRVDHVVGRKNVSDVHNATNEKAKDVLHVANVVADVAAANLDERDAERTIRTSPSSLRPSLRDLVRPVDAADEKPLRVEGEAPSDMKPAAVDIVKVVDVVKRDILSPLAASETPIQVADAKTHVGNASGVIERHVPVAGSSDVRSATSVTHRPSVDPGDKSRRRKDEQR